MGIPVGNTVALAGDPGSGKTTFLLSYFHHGECRYHGERRQLCAGPQPGKGSITDINTLEDHLKKSAETARTDFDRLIIPVGFQDGHEGEKKSKENSKPGTLRCFISLESSFERIVANHKWMRDAAKDNPNSEDIHIFVDATSFLSGRLEDRLRYPRLSQNERQADNPDNGWKSYSFSIGGYESQAELYALFW